jgi:hypothetical protein
LRTERIGDGTQGESHLSAPLRKAHNGDRRRLKPKELSK